MSVKGTERPNGFKTHRRVLPLSDSRVPTIVSCAIEASVKRLLRRRVCHRRPSPLLSLEYSAPKVATPVQNR